MSKSPKSMADTWLNIRFATDADAATLAKIDLAAHAPGGHGRAWWRNMIRESIPCGVGSVARYHVKILEDPKGVAIAFAVFEMHPEWLQVIRMAVVPNRRRAGAGSVMARHVMRCAAKLFRRCVEIIVPDHNLGAHLFLKSCGFKANAFLKGAFDNDDGIIFHVFLKSDGSENE